MTTTQFEVGRETCNSAVLQTLAPYESVEGWPAGKLLYRESESPTGVYVLLSGEVDLLFSSRSGQAKPLRIAEAGQILGLSCVVSGRMHDCSATARTACVTGFIAKDKFLSLLDENPSLWFSVLQMLSTDINSCYDCMRTLTATR